MKISDTSKVVRNLSFQKFEKVGHIIIIKYLFNSDFTDIFNDIHFIIEVFRGYKEHQSGTFQNYILKQKKVQQIMLTTIREVELFLNEKKYF